MNPITGTTPLLILSSRFRREGMFTDCVVRPSVRYGSKLALSAYRAPEHFTLNNIRLKCLLLFKMDTWLVQPLHPPARLASAPQEATQQKGKGCIKCSEERTTFPTCDL